MTGRSVGRHFLIDGYNVINSLPGLRTGEGRSVEAAVRLLADAAADLASLEGGKCSIFLDGDGRSATEQEVRSGSVMLIYPAAGKSADDGIAAVVAAGEGPLTVVSSDGAVQAAAVAGGALRMTPREFWERARPPGGILNAEADGAGPEPARGLHPLLDNEVRRAMDRMAGRDPEGLEIP